MFIVDHEINKDNMELRLFVVWISCKIFNFACRILHFIQILGGFISANLNFLPYFNCLTDILLYDTGICVCVKDILLLLFF